jgi:hypothetical protein
MTMTENLIQNACDNIDEQIRLYHEMIAKLGELKRGLLLADLIGRKPSEIKGTLSTRVVNDNTTLRPWKSASFWVREKFPDGSTTETKLPLIEVPLDLWPEDLRDRYLRFKAHERRQKEKSQTSK